MTNVKSGARSPVSGIVHSITLFVVLLVLAPAAGYIPLSALAAVLLWVAFNMVPWGELRQIRKFSMFYRAILLTTLALTVIFDLAVAVETGLVLSSLFFIYRIASLTKVEALVLPPGREVLPDGRRVGAWELFGSIFFASVTKIESLLDPAKALPDVVILEMHKIINIDTTGLDAFESLHLTLRKRGGRLILVDLNEQPMSLLVRSGFITELGRENLFDDLDEAIEASAATPPAPP
jgi:SulP family sulfate permease